MARRELGRGPRLLVQRVLAGVLVLLGIPAVITIGTMTPDAAVAAGEPAPRTIVATRAIRVVDEAATELARQTAREAVDAQYVADREAQAQIVSDVRELFDLVSSARAEIEVEPLPEVSTDPETGEVATVTPEPTTRVPTVSEQLEQLTQQTDLLPEQSLRDLVELSGPDLRDVEADAVDLAQDLARVPIQPQEVQEDVQTFLDEELAVRSFPAELATDVIEPLLQRVARPTEQVDPVATANARDQAEARVEQEAEVFDAGEPIITRGQPVEPLQLLALERLQLLGLDNDGPLLTALRVLGIVGIAALAVLGYLWRMQPAVFTSGRKLLVVATLMTGHAVTVAVVAFLTTAGSATWWYVIPSAAVAMLAAMLVTPWVGVATMLTSTALVLVTFPGEPGLAVFTAASVVMSVPFMMRLQSRGDLRSATLRVALLLPGLAVITELVFGSVDDVALTLLAALANGLLTVLLVQGLLPFLEGMFRLPTVTALLDLADRNHPLLRELEQKAMGTYNHSVAVASLVERACREIGANALLGSVAALYHDIGKVRQPHFFIENQRGIMNPHDELEPQVSALIIQDHVKNGVAMAREYKLPPEVVACIGSHHGTMLVSYFYRQALAAANEGEEVDESVFRYDGSKPRSREAAVLLLADCCEATTRSMTMSSGTMGQDQIEEVVDKLLQERIDDAQFAESELTFSDLYRVRDSIVDALVGIYHPRIAYPDATPRVPAG